jgi:opacity protein-like surface antigen
MTMSTNRLCLSLAALAATCCGAVQAEAAPPGGFYIAGAVTGSALDKPKQTIAHAPTPGTTLQVVNDADFGWGGQAEVGYIHRFLRIEGEFGRSGNHSAKYAAIRPIAITLPQSGENTVTRYMANVFVEMPRGHWAVNPLIGVGIGAAHGHVTTFAAPARAPNVPPSQLLDFSDTRLAYQLMGGLSVPITRHAALTAQYRWFDAGTFEGVDSRGERATRTLHGSNVDLGVRFTF